MQAIRHWAEIAYVPSDGVATRDRPAPPRYLVLRVSQRQGGLFADGSTVRHFAVVTNLPTGRRQRARPDPVAARQAGRSSCAPGAQGRAGRRGAASGKFAAKRPGSGSMWRSTCSPLKRVALPVELRQRAQAARRANSPAGRRHAARPSRRSVRPAAGSPTPPARLATAHPTPTPPEPPASPPALSPASASHAHSHPARRATPRHAMGSSRSAERSTRIVGSRVKGMK